MRLKSMKVCNPRDFRFDEYEANDDVERRKRVEAHRRRVQRELKRQTK